MPFCLLCARLRSLLLLDENEHRYSNYGSRGHWSCRCYDARTNDPDVLPHILCDLHRDASRDSRDAVDVRGGKSSSSGDDDKRSNDANTSHVPNNCERTTNPASIPNTKGCAMRTKRRSRTSRR